MTSDLPGSQLHTGLRALAAIQSAALCLGVSLLGQVLFVQNADAKGRQDGPRGEYPDLASTPRGLVQGEKASSALHTHYINNRIVVSCKEFNPFYLKPGHSSAYTLNSFLFCSITICSPIPFFISSLLLECTVSEASRLKPCSG